MPAVSAESAPPGPFQSSILTLYGAPYGYGAGL